MSNEVRVAGSLRKRFVFTLIAGVALLTILLYFVVRNYATQIAQQGQDSILNASVTAILDAVSVRDGKVETDIPYHAFSMLSTATDDRVFYAIAQDNKVLSGYETLTIPRLTLDTPSKIESTTFLGVPVRQVSASRQFSGTIPRITVTATIAQTQDNLTDTLNQISRNAAILGIGFFSLAVALSLWATSTTIAPLQRLADSVGRRGPQDLSPVVKPVPSELQPLVSSLNRLMARLDQSFKQSEDFIAEAAHRVRTPIATVRSHAETTLQRVDKEDNRQALRSMIRAIDETSRAATQMLDHAMITSRANHLEYQEVDLGELVTEIQLRMTPIAEMKEVELRLHADNGATIPGDPILIQNAVRNIIDNALKYSPDESVIDISVIAKPTARVIVSDEGPGFLLEEIDSLTGRFTRGKNAIDTTGSGLGLTIASDVAEAHNGALTMSNNSDGGACVSLSF
ncbi:MAG: sensor histidine kinase [Granulosicoccus sp.]|nr:sensor histidine kinase [Granulosicoccus sp.]